MTLACGCAQVSSCTLDRLWIYVTCAVWGGWDLKRAYWLREAR